MVAYFRLSRRSTRLPARAPTLQFVIKDSPCYIGLNKDEPKLLAKINEIIAQAKASGEIGKLSENCQHVGGVPITSGASGTVAFTDGAQEKLASPSNCKIPSGVQLPPAASPEAKPHPRPKATVRAIHALYQSSH